VLGNCGFHYEQVVGQLAATVTPRRARENDSEKPAARKERTVDKPKRKEKKKVTRPKGRPRPPAARRRRPVQQLPAQQPSIIPAARFNSPAIWPASPPLIALDDHPDVASSIIYPY
jgi:hypothetical protein